MKERFTAQGSRDLWLASTLEAFEVSGFRNIFYQPGEDQVTGYLNGKLVADINDENNSIVLGLNSDSQENIDVYKATVAPIFARLSKEPEDLLNLRLSTPVIPESPSINTEDIFEPSEEEIEILEKVDKSQHEVPEETKEETEPEPWYRSPWFVLLVSVLVPPIGIYLMWHYHIFYDKDRKIFTSFFLIYTVLWLCLLYILISPLVFPNRSIISFPTQTIDETGTKLEQLDAYWQQQDVKNYVDQMPGLLDNYENLYVNSELGLQEGNAQAEDIYNQIQALVNGVMSIAPLSEENAAYTLQRKVNESADLFNMAIQEGRDSINSGDPAKIEAAMNSWNTAENAFYEISYIYEQAVKAANDELNSNQNESNDVIIVEDENQTNNNVTPETEQAPTITTQDTQTETTTEEPVVEETIEEEQTQETVEETIVE